MRHASRLQPSFKHFCGISHIIPSDGDDIFDYCRPISSSTENTNTDSTSCHKTRENVILEKSRENTESNPLDISPLKSTPVTTTFHSNTPDILQKISSHPPIVGRNFVC